MKNLIPYKDDCFEMHKQAVDNKKDLVIKDKLLGINKDVENEYVVFLAKFDKNELNLLKPNAAISLYKEELIALYNYQNSVIRSIRESIRTSQARTIQATCQYCTIDSVHTLDHILPKKMFPEFIVNPKNLFPCCQTCNTYKS
jgi:hypothetical protein